jgi:hypothetical protein
VEIFKEQEKKLITEMKKKCRNDDRWRSPSYISEAVIRVEAFFAERAEARHEDYLFLLKDLKEELDEEHFKNSKEAAVKFILSKISQQRVSSKPSQLSYAHKLSLITICYNELLLEVLMDARKKYKVFLEDPHIIAELIMVVIENKEFINNEKVCKTEQDLFYKNLAASILCTPF